MRGPEIGYHRQWSEGHGRDEFRRCWATSDLPWLAGREEWGGLRGVAMIEAERFIGDELSVERRYYLSSLPNDARLLNEAVRSHWAVEDSLHWVLDVTFQEDRSRISKENAPESFGLASSPSLVREPEGNGCAERFIRTPKEQLLWVRTFATVAELVEALGEFERTYNERWLIGRHEHRPPSQVRQDLIGGVPTAA